MQISFSKAIYGLASCPDALQGRHAFLLLLHERLLNVERSYHYVRAVIPARSAKPPGIYPHVCGSTWSLKDLSHFQTFKTLSNAALYVLMSVLAS